MASKSVEEHRKTVAAVPSVAIDSLLKGEKWGNGETRVMTESRNGVMKFSR